MRRLSRRQRWAALLLAVVAAAFVALDATGGSLRAAHSGVRGTLGALYRGTDSVLGPVRRFVQGLPHAASDENRLAALEHQNRLLRARLRDDAVDRATARVLARLQLTAAAQHAAVLPARVIAFDPASGFDWTVTLDVGRADGARAGQTVTDGYALVGRVISADPSTSTVLLAVDPKSGVGVRDERTGELCLATGAGVDGFTVTPLRPDAKLAAGDRLVTGPAGASSYAAGLSVGTVRTATVTSGGRMIGTASPATSPTALDVVGLIVRHGDQAPATAGRAALPPRPQQGRGTSR